MDKFTLWNSKWWIIILEDPKKIYANQTGCQCIFSVEFSFFLFST